MRFNRTVEYRVKVSGGYLDRYMISISVMNETLRPNDVEAIQDSGFSILAHTANLAWDLPPALPASERDVQVEAISRSFAYEIANNHVRQREFSGHPISESAVVELLLSPEMKVARFGSPPTSWVELKDVMAHAAGTFAAMGSGGGIPTLVLAYVGAVVVVRFIDPIAQAAGSALADGVGAAIRRGFGLNEPPQVGAVDSSEGTPQVGAAGDESAAE
ncbi:hypothetical protein ACQF36_41520 [Streptomyces sp. Marseille-Q5077]|uniref:hypothetical protein n=1 Tax=Streptomyces sp. Marseille-Q5077 TaxID=3418995 RepID=UPI003D05D759